LAALADAGAAGEKAARIAARPSRTLGSEQSILEDGRLEKLFEDRLFWTLIQNGSIDYAMNRNAMRSMVLDPGVRGPFADPGLCAAEIQQLLAAGDIFPLIAHLRIKRIVDRIHSSLETRSAPQRKEASPQSRDSPHRCVGPHALSPIEGPSHVSAMPPGSAAPQQPGVAYQNAVLERHAS